MQKSGGGGGVVVMLAGGKVVFGCDECFQVQVAVEHPVVAGELHGPAGAGGGLVVRVHGNGIARAN